jgi:predicted dehydrogenase/threonine dehydrogenase-like Zn-dependent dehydrogenase
MKQLYQDPKARGIQVADLPPPALQPGAILVRNAFSVISPGSERHAVRMVRDSLLATARSRPDLVRRVLETVRREGVLAAYRKIEARRGELRALGYSSAGIVTAVGEGAGPHFRVGDRVACGGAGYASHAEVVSVPVNLAARVPEEVPLEAAAFATLGAIALHGVRQAEPGLGDRFAVIGLGLMGLLTLQLLRAAGARVMAFDLSPALVERARRLGAESAAAGTADEQVALALSWSEGIGVDGVVVTATASDDAPMVAAAGMCRERGRVTALGLVPFGLPREVAYEKELELRIARSYGPGRYDARFEEHGQDYPIGYVRWTETRNLESFLQLTAEGKVTPLDLITHRFGIDEASRAYDLLLARAAEQPLGVLLAYPASGAPLAEPGTPDSVIASSFTAGKRRSRTSGIGPDGNVNVGVIGAGAFARSTLLPILKGMRGVSLRTVVTAHGLTALDAQRRFGFDHIGTDADLLLNDPDIHLVVIATRHDTHAELAARALQAGKHVFVEKPLALDESELALVEAAAAVAPGLLMVGFNRRFSPHARALRQVFAQAGPLMMSYRINAGPLPAGHWLNDPAIGGGRIVGEACHFIDLMSFLTGDAGIVSVQAKGSAASPHSQEEVSSTLEFADGSVGQLLYATRGSPSAGKELLEIHAGGLSARLEDFRTCRLYGSRFSRRIKGHGKGHPEAITECLRAVREGSPSPVANSVAMVVARGSFRIRQLLGE